MEPTAPEETGAVASEFVRKVHERNLPIPDDQAAAFERFHIEHNSPPGFLDRVLDGCYYLDEETFNLALAQMRDRINDQFQDRDYSFLMEHSNGSSEWIYEKLLALGLKPAAAVFARSQSRGETKYKDLTKQKPRGPVVAIDDWTITAKQLRWTFDEMPRGKEKHVFLMNATSYAGDLLKGQYPTIDIQTFAPEIKTLSEALTADDLAYIDNLKPKAYGLDYNTRPEEQSLTWSFYKTPDNVPNLFMGIPHETESGEQIPGLIPVIRFDRKQ